MRRLAVVFLLAVAMLGCATPAQASCAAPTIAVSPSPAFPGQLVTLHGQGFGTVCNDTGRNRLNPPAQGISLTFSQSGKVTPLGTVNADKNYSFTVRVCIPTTARPGPATITGKPFFVLSGKAPVPCTAPQLQAGPVEPTRDYGRIVTLLGAVAGLGLLIALGGALAGPATRRS